MIKHLIKLLWNRKRANALVVVEIFFSFIVLFAVVALGVYYAGNYRRPLGFSYENVWNIKLEMKQTLDDTVSPEQTETVRQLYQVLREFNEIEAIAGAATPPFANSQSYGVLQMNGGELSYRRNEATDGFDKVMGLTLVSGRWFGAEDDGAAWQPVVINRQMARAIFGNEDVVGQDIPLQPDQTRTRVIGVVTDVRHGGEFSDSENLIFYRNNLSDLRNQPPNNLMIKLRAGTTRAFEEKLIGRLQDVAKQWSFEVQPLAALRDANWNQTLIPVMTAGLVAGFLLIMVALGLTGVLWQNVTQRTREIGLRRAQGATAWHIYRQIVSELLIITSAGLLVGIAVVVQFPLLNIVGWISGQVYALGIVISTAIIYLLTIICALYPSWMAAKVQPVEALHHD